MEVSAAREAGKHSARCCTGLPPGWWVFPRRASSHRTYLLQRQPQRTILGRTLFNDLEALDRGAVGPGLTTPGAHLRADRRQGGPGVSEVIAHSANSFRLRSQRPNIDHNKPPVENFRFPEPPEAPLLRGKQGPSG